MVCETCQTEMAEAASIETPDDCTTVFICDFCGHTASEVTPIADPPPEG